MNRQSRAEKKTHLTILNLRQMQAGKVATIANAKPDNTHTNTHTVQNVKSTDAEEVQHS